MLLQLPAGVGDDTVLAGLVDLGQDCPQASRLLVVAETGICNQGIRPVIPGVVHNRFRAQVGLQLQEGLECSLG